jgi:hypothetical protein
MMNIPDRVFSLRSGKALFLEHYSIGRIKMGLYLHACSLKHKAREHCGSCSEAHDHRHAEM